MLEDNTANRLLRCGNADSTSPTDSVLTSTPSKTREYRRFSIRKSSPSSRKECPSTRRSGPTNDQLRRNYMLTIIRPVVRQRSAPMSPCPPGEGGGVAHGREYHAKAWDMYLTVYLQFD